MAFKSILDPNFRYRDSRSTDVRKTFERIKRQQRINQKAESEVQFDKVVTIGKVARKTA